MSLSCQYCISQGRIAIKRRCSECKGCVEHKRCKCRGCQLCGKRRAPIALCRLCCVCFEHHKDRFALTFPARKCVYIKDGTAKPTFLLNSLQRSLGIELEIAETMDAEHNQDLKGLGRWDHDGSVKPSEKEFGLVPLKGDVYFETVAKVLDVFHAAGSTVNDTCGFHVHVDSADLTAQELRRVLVGFAGVQNGIFGTLVEANRANPSPNGVNYCAPINQSRATLAHLMKLKTRKEIMHWFYMYLYQLTFPKREEVKAPKGLTNQEMYESMVREANAALNRAKETKYMNAARRHAINFHSWMMRGTIEFRLKEGSLTASEVLNWPLWCGWFVERVSTMPDAKVLGWLDSPPDVVTLTKQWYDSKFPARPNIALVDWVAEKAAHPTKAAPVAPKAQPPAGPRAWVRPAMDAQLPELAQAAGGGPIFRRVANVVAGADYAVGLGEPQPPPNQPPPLVAGRDYGRWDSPRGAIAQYVPGDHDRRNGAETLFTYIRGRRIMMRTMVWEAASRSWRFRDDPPEVEPAAEPVPF